MEIKNIVLLVVFIIGVVFMQFVKAQSVDDVINKYIEARGGKDKLNAIQSLYMEGTRQMMGTDVLVKVTTVQGKLFRTDFEVGGTTGYTIVTPAAGWSFIPMQSPKVEPLPADRLKSMQGQLDILGPLIDFAAKGSKGEMDGKETIDGKEAYKIKVTLSTGNEMTFYIDTKTYLLIQSRQMAPARGNAAPQEIITNYNDYKLFDGVMFPQTIANPAAGVMSGSTTFDTIVINKTIDESQYKPSK